MRRASLALTQSAGPVLPDTDAETSIDLDKSVGTLGQESKRTNFTKSVFDITIEDLETPNERKEANAYEAHLRQEIKNWNKYITKALVDLKNAKQNHPVVDCTILPKEKRDFFEQAPDLQRFLRRMREFRCEAVRFMDNDYAEMLALQQNVADVCTRQLKLAKENFLAERLANYEEI